MIAIDPMSVEAYLGMADAYIGMGDQDKAIEILKRGYDQTKNEDLKWKWESLSESEQNTEADSEVDLKGSSDENEPDEIQQKIEKLVTLFAEGCTNNMFQFEEIRFLGHDILDMSLSEMESILTENNNDTTCDDMSVWSGEYKGLDSASVLGTDFDHNGSVDVLSYSVHEGSEEQPMPTGIRGIYTYDVMENVLTEFGFSNGKEIWEYINDSFADLSVDEVEVGELQISDNLILYVHFGDFNAEDGKCDCSLQFDYLDTNRTISFDFLQNGGKIMHLMEVFIFIEE